MNKDHAIILLMVMVTLFLGGLFVHEKLAFKKNDQKNTVSVQNEQPATNEPDLETSDWKIYRNEKLGIEFQYPGDMEVVYDERGGSTEEGEARETIRIQQNGHDKIYINHLINFDLKNYRKHWVELDDLAQQEGDKKISQGEHQLKVNNISVTRFDYCGFTLAGVSCDFLRSDYLVSLRDGSYLMVKVDVWETPRENTVLLSTLVESFQYL